MDGEDPGLLGGLPRERPGTRSDKRSDGSEQRRGAAPKRPVESPPSTEADEPGGPVRGAGRIAGAGLKVAGGLTRGVLRRLPRP